MTKKVISAIRGNPRITEQHVSKTVIDLLESAAQVLPASSLPSWL
jgi:hypothetical protein